MKNLLRGKGLLVSMLVMVVLSTACVGKPPAQIAKLTEKSSLGVAGFTQPRYERELMAGYLPENAQPISAETMVLLDEAMSSEVAKRRTNFVDLSAARQCREIVSAETGADKIGAFQYWLRIGKCMKVDYLLVPQALMVVERIGANWGVDQPAEVTLDFYLIDIPREKLAGRHHFEQKQRSLSENILDAGKFFKRGGKWLSSVELAREGIIEALEDLGI